MTKFEMTVALPLQRVKTITATGVVEDVAYMVNDLAAKHDGVILWDGARAYGVQFYDPEITRMVERVVTENVIVDVHRNAIKARNNDVPLARIKRLDG